MMDALFEYELSSWHPVLVHVPVVTLVLGCLSVLGWSLRRHGFWYRCALLLYGIGFTGGLAAYFTGEPLLEQMEGEPIVDRFVSLHEDLALYVLIVAGLTLLLLMAVAGRDRSVLVLQPGRPVSQAVRIALVVLGVGSGVLILATAHLGGIMVWGSPG